MRQQHITLPFPCLEIYQNTLPSTMSWWWTNAYHRSPLSKPTAVFGIKLWILIAAAAALVLFTLLLLSLYLASLRHRHRRRRRRRASFSKLQSLDPTPPISKEIPQIIPPPPPPPPPPEVLHLDVIPSKPVLPSFSTASGESRRSSEPSPRSGGLPEVSHLGWGHWYTLRELEEATGGFAEENIVGEGGYGIVYHGVLQDGTNIAIKNLLNNKGQAEKEFRVEVDAIGRVRHKNLVRLLGYCAEGAQRMLVYEYVDNGNLDQWLHGEVGEVSPLTWEIRINIILGTAKGLAYLHEGLEPKVVHRDVKASNILLDRQWHPKVSDFGLAKLLCSEKSYVTTRVMGTFGYVAPEYACTGMLNEKSDVYSFGVLIMEIISGRAPVDYTRAPGEVHLVEWLKSMVGDRKFEPVVDPKMSEKPSSKALKRALLVALRCIDPDAHNRPKMGYVIHMLEADDLLVRDDHKQGQEIPSSRRDYSHGKQSLDKYDANEEKKHDRR